MATTRQRTLALFPEVASPMEQPHRRRRTSGRDLVLHIYWSSSVEAQALAGAARSATSASERRALEALHQLELSRRDLARSLLEEVWGVRIAPEPAQRHSA
ncbi:MAG TPA: hypothetical protein VFC51_02500 [Chloroflexota bacterium]|nr:hypothetical protein [Chloroflexota bacterium]